MDPDHAPRLRVVDCPGDLDEVDEADLNLVAPRRAPPGDPRVEVMAEHFRAIMDVLDLDRNDPNLEGTDRRVARMYVELFSGLAEGAEPAVTTFPNSDGYNQMVAVHDVPFYSMCAHHFLPFFGRAHVAYVPSEQIVGLSKLARIVEFYARRPQIQERLTEQVISFIDERLRPKGAIVVIEANHLCMEMRGVRKPGSMTTTSAIRGSFRDRATREEFFDLLHRRGS